MRHTKTKIGANKPWSSNIVPSAAQCPVRRPNNIMQISRFLQMISSTGYPANSKSNNNNFELHQGVCVHMCVTQRACTLGKVSKPEINTGTNTAISTNGPGKTGWLYAKKNVYHPAETQLSKHQRHQHKAGYPESERREIWNCHGI